MYTPSPCPALQDQNACPITSFELLLLTLKAWAPRHAGRGIQRTPNTSNGAMTATPTLHHFSGPRQWHLSKLQPIDICFQERPNTLNSHSFHRLHQLHNVTAHAPALIRQYFRESERIVSLQRMELRLFQLLDDAHITRQGSLLEQALEVGSIPYIEVAMFDYDQS